jgi:transcriptional regulator with XRE-family HTH domain
MLRGKISEILKKKKITAYRLCKETGIDQGHFSHFLKGQKDLSIKNLERIMSYLGLVIVEEGFAGDLKTNKKILKKKIGDLFNSKEWGGGQEPAIRAELKKIKSRTLVVSADEARNKKMMDSIRSEKDCFGHYCDDPDCKSCSLLTELEGRREKLWVICAWVTARLSNKDKDAEAIFNDLKEYEGSLPASTKKC